MKLRIQINIVYLLIYSSGFQIYSQERVYNGNRETSFENARNLAFNNQRKQAQDSLKALLIVFPEYQEARQFLGTTYTWDGDYVKARNEFETVLTQDPESKTTWIAAIKNELWGENPSLSLEITSKALLQFPEDLEILYLRAKAQNDLNNPLAAFSITEFILDKNPENQQAKDFQQNLNTKLRVNSIGINAAVDIYSQVFDPMQFYSLIYGRITKYGSFIGRLNFNRRFNENGKQLELDLYPKISEGLYAFVNIGLANSFLFPDLKYGGELFQSLPKGLEISLGFRVLKYSSTTTIYTGSLGWYQGNNYWLFRTYLTPGEAGTSKSGTFSFRKYRDDANNYIRLALGIGFTPEINPYNLNGNRIEIINLKAQKINLGYFFTSSNKQNVYGSQIEVSHQEISFDLGNYFWIYSFSFLWEIRFK